MKRSIFGLCLFFALAGFSVQAQHTKVGNVDLVKIFENMPERKKIDSLLNSQKKQWDEMLQSKSLEYDKKVEKFQQLSQNTMVSDAMKEQARNDAQKAGMEVEELERKALNDLQAQEDKLLEPVYARIKASIKKVAEANGYSHVINGNEQIVLFSKDEYNITNLVMKDLGITAAATTTGNAPKPAPANNNSTTILKNK